MRAGRTAGSGVTANIQDCSVGDDVSARRDLPTVSLSKLTQTPSASGESRLGVAEDLRVSGRFPENSERDRPVAALGQRHVGIASKIKSGEYGSRSEGQDVSGSAKRIGQGIGVGIDDCSGSPADPVGLAVGNTGNARQGHGTVSDQVQTSVDDEI